MVRACPRAAIAGDLSGMVGHDLAAVARQSSPVVFLRTLRRFRAPVHIRLVFWCRYVFICCWQYVLVGVLPGSPAGPGTIPPAPSDKAVVCRAASFRHLPSRRAAFSSAGLGRRGLRTPAGTARLLCIAPGRQSRDCGSTGGSSAMAGGVDTSAGWIWMWARHILSVPMPSPARAPPPHRRRWARAGASGQPGASVVKSSVASWSSGRPSTWPRPRCRLVRYLRTCTVSARGTHAKMDL
ncbi:hypothetical protein FsymDg_0414 [Candidatus Protofrankia datiscae]|uniref:Uncharacterized protein n=1 Tax=Candidatus Protofrankia datiscae TaxID=2716812 RepID=F8B5B9_9ACTN|nr:hypothetical protein FsymDg_0414 [Candidatus Protofrankia datiscae]